MVRPPIHRESHALERVGWLRAGVLGANDGILSTASLIVGVAAAGAGAQQIFLTGVAGLVAGAMSMAAGEYVSVSSQADTEQADLTLERQVMRHAAPAASPASQRYQVSGRSRITTTAPSKITAEAR
jgi:VIT1/CCC1 family predicted Fe2+/Mn2+ transporter